MVLDGTSKTCAILYGPTPIPNSIALPPFSPTALKIR